MSVTALDRLLARLEPRHEFESPDRLNQREARKREEIACHNFDRERHDAAVIQRSGNLAPHLRSKWETVHNLKRRDIRRAGQHVRRGVNRCWHFAVPGAVPFRRTPLFNAAPAAGNACDAVLRSVPALRLMAGRDVRADQG